MTSTLASSVSPSHNVHPALSQSLSLVSEFVTIAETSAHLPHEPLKHETRTTNHSKTPFWFDANSATASELYRIAQWHSAHAVCSHNRTNLWRDFFSPRSLYYRCSNPRFSGTRVQDMFCGFTLFIKFAGSLSIPFQSVLSIIELCSKHRAGPVFFLSDIAWGLIPLVHIKIG